MSDAKRRVLWSHRADRSLQAIVRHIAEDNPSAAAQFVNTIVARVEGTLESQPLSGRPGRVAGTREWVAHKNYVVAYRVTAKGDVQVLDIIHSARLWPEQF